MRKIELRPCEKEGCTNFCTVFKTSGRVRESSCCLYHLVDDTSWPALQELVDETNGQWLVLDGRRPGESLTPLRFTSPVNEKFKGCLFIGIDFNAEDFKEADFSFCTFAGCDLRRVRLYNSNLRWAAFHRCLLRQADIDNSDCRWMRTRGDRETTFAHMLGRIAEWAGQNTKKPPQLGLQDQAEFFLRHFGYKPDEEDKDLFAQKKFGKLKEKNQKLDASDRSPMDSPSFFAELALSIEKMDLSGATLQNSDFAHADFSGCIAHETSFAGSDLHEAIFCSAHLERSSFLNASFARTPLNAENCTPARSRFCEADMTACTLEGVNLSNTYFEKTILPFARMKNAHIENSVFFGCTMQHIDASDTVANTNDAGNGTGDAKAKSCAFLACDLSGASFASAFLKHAQFHFDPKREEWKSKNSPEMLKALEENWAALLAEKRPTATSLKGTNFQAAELEGANFDQANLSGALLLAATLNNATLRGAKCVGAQFNASVFGGANFSHANLTECDFRSASIAKNPPRFFGTTLSSANLSEVDLSCTGFINCAMDDINLSECDLSGVVITSVDNKCVPMSRSSLRSSSIQGMHLENVDMTSSDLSYLVMSEDRASDDRVECMFTDVDLFLANFTGSIINDGRFRNCNIRKTDFQTSVLEDCIFEKCVLDDVRFKSSVLTNVDFIDFNEFKDIDFSESEFTGGTIRRKPKEPLNPPAAPAIIASSATIEDVAIEGISFGASTFKDSIINIKACKNVCFATCDFSNANLQIANATNVNFFYSNFHLTILSLDGPWRKGDESQPGVVFLGCDLDEATFGSAPPFDPANVLFADCCFRQTSFLADPESGWKWTKALLVHNRFVDQKYSGLRESEIKSRNQDGLPFKEFIDRCRAAIVNDNTTWLENARTLAKSNNLAKRLGILLPDQESLAQSQGHDLAKSLCREFRTDCQRQGLSELSKEAHILEKDNELLLKCRQLPESSLNTPILALAKKDCILLRTFFISSFLIFILSGGHESESLSNSFKTQFSYVLAHIAPSAFLAVLFLSIAYWEKILRFIIDFAKLFFPIRNLKKYIPMLHLFTVKNLYQYGENIPRMVGSVAICILLYNIVYFLFTPDCNYCNDPSLDCKECIQPLAGDFGAQYIQNSTCAAYIKKIQTAARLQGNLGALCRTGWFDWGAFLTSFYFSGITFTTLGYSDICPQGGFRIVAISEALLGAFFVALLVYVFTRRDS